MRIGSKLLLAALTAGLATGAPASAATPAAATKAAFARVSSVAKQTPLLQPKRFAAFEVDTAKLSAALEAAPALRGGAAPLTISLPTPEGAFARFAVRETSVMEPALAAKHPEIKTYAGESLDVQGSEVRLELTPLGLSASVRGPGADYYIDPRYAGDPTESVVYQRSALSDPRPEATFIERDVVGEQVRAAEGAAPADRAAGEPVKLKTFRLALVSDPSYAANNGASGNTTAAKVVLMDRVNQIYEADVQVHMVLIAATDRLNLDTAALATSANGACGAQPCFTAEDLASCSSALLDRNVVVAGLLAKARDFDIGHIVLGKNGGGIAGLGVVGGASKASGCTGIPRPVGDYFAVDYVAHEMGHEFGGNHTFGGDQLNCALLNRNAFTGVEPGSGSSVMAYAGICGQDNLQPHSDPYFSQKSIDEITTQYAVEPDLLSSVQQTAFKGLTATGTYKLSYDGGPATTVLSGASTAAMIKAAIEQRLPMGGTVAVGTPATSGYTVTFGGTLTEKPVGLLSVVEPSAGVSGFVGELQAGGPTGERGFSTVATANRVPAVTTPPAFTVPIRTPFSLTATGGDADGNPLTYLWEQNDTTPVADPLVLGSGQGTLLVSNTKTFGPLFRVFGTAARYPESEAYLNPSPNENRVTTTPTRDLPDVQQVMADNTNALTGSCPTVTPSQYDPVMGMLVVQGEPVSDSVADCFSEYLPTASYRGDGTGAMHFRVTARDGVAGMGGIAHADTTLTLAPAAGPFRITAPARNLVYPIGGDLPVTWNVARTDTAPVSTARVRVLFSADAGKSFPLVLSASTPNDGTETLKLPAGLTTEQGRVRVEAVGNVFYDASRNNISVVDSSLPPAGTTGSAGTAGDTGVDGTGATGQTGTTGQGGTGGGAGSGGQAGSTGTPGQTGTPGPAGPAGPSGTLPVRPAAFTASVAVDRTLRRTARTSGLRVRQRCSAACTLRLSFLVDAKSAKALGLRSRVVGSATRRFTAAGRATQPVKLKAGVARRVLARRASRLTLRTVITSASGKTTRTKAVVLTGR